ncbi:DUF2510 domain-containing protein [Microbacteriaceae bacterium VKM Ac-2854]|nr:DUF2510 domain-containing protein [Microbacteriaceae bacterium VKM Ac-2854]
MSDPRAPLPSTPPPGWYPHPADLGTELYWDGSAWTTLSRPAPGTESAPAYGTPPTDAAATTSTVSPYDASATPAPSNGAPYGSPYASPESGAYPTSAPAARNNLAIASLVLGIVGLIINPFYVPSILAIVFGARSRQAAKLAGAPMGMSTAGLVLGIVGIVAAFAVRYLFNS